MQMENELCVCVCASLQKILFRKTKPTASQYTANGNEARLYSPPTENNQPCWLAGLKRLINPPKTSKTLTNEHKKETFSVVVVPLLLQPYAATLRPPAREDL